MTTSSTATITVSEGGASPRFGNPVIGTTSEAAGSGFKFGSVYTLNEAGTARSFSLYTRGGGFAAARDAGDLPRRRVGPAHDARGHRRRGDDRRRAGGGLGLLDAAGDAVDRRPLPARPDVGPDRRAGGELLHPRPRTAASGTRTPTGRRARRGGRSTGRTAATASTSPTRRPSPGHRPRTPRRRRSREPPASGSSSPPPPAPGAARRRASPTSGAAATPRAPRAPTSPAPSRARTRGRRRRRKHAPRRRDGVQRRRLRVRHLGRDRGDRARPAGEHGPPVVSGTADAGSHAVDHRRRSGRARRPASRTSGAGATPPVPHARTSPARPRAPTRWTRATSARPSARSSPQPTPAGRDRPPRRPRRSSCPSRPSTPRSPSSAARRSTARSCRRAPATWTDSPASYAYQWRRCDTGGGDCAAIAGATLSTYTLTGTDVGATIRVAVTAANAGGQATATSDATGVVAPAAPHEHRPARRSPAPPRAGRR